jgi:hypothetical protein
LTTSYVQSIVFLSSGFDNSRLNLHHGAPPKYFPLFHLTRQ